VFEPPRTIEEDAGELVTDDDESEVVTSKHPSSVMSELDR
jgi:hypothetical protein